MQLPKSVPTSNPGWLGSPPKTRPPTPIATRGRTTCRPISGPLLTQVQLAIPLTGGRLALGTWQGIYLFEHRRRPHRRSVALHLIGE